MMLIVLIPSAYAQEMNPWKLLSDVKIENRMDESVGYEISYPVFGEKAKSLNGEIITFKGYMIPYEVYLGSKYFILSALPIAACFFVAEPGQRR